MEGICGQGEVLHVPSGWWHLVVNLEPGIAITQNFVPEAHLPKVLDFLKNKSDQVSGFIRDIEDPYELFVQKLKASHSDLLAGALAELEKSTTGKKRKWDELVNNGSKTQIPGTNGFSFGFGTEDNDIP